MAWIDAGQKNRTATAREVGEKPFLFSQPLANGPPPMAASRAKSAPASSAKKPLTTRIQQALENYVESCPKERERFRPGAKAAALEALNETFDGALCEAAVALYTLFDGSKGAVPSFAKVLAEREPVGDDARVRFLSTKEVAVLGPIDDGDHVYVPFGYVESLEGGSKKDDAPVTGLDDGEGFVLVLSESGEVGYGYLEDGEFEDGFSSLADDLPAFFALLADKMKPKKPRGPSALAQLLAPPPPPPSAPAATGEPSPGAIALAAALLKQEKIQLEEDADEDDLVRAIDLAIEGGDAKHKLRALLEGESPIEESFLDDDDIHKIVRAFV